MIEGPLLNMTIISIILGLIAIYFIIYRLIDWRRLRGIPGPTIAGWTDAYLLRHVISGKLCTKLTDICNQYGE